MSAATYTAVGSSAPLFGTTWDTENTANDLQLKNGTLYELVKEVALKAGEIQLLKIVFYKVSNGIYCLKTPEV